MGKKKVGRGVIFWLPRILAMLLIAFLALFSLDVFELGLGFLGTILALVIHNIPVFILTALLIVAWRYEIVGAVTFIFGGLLYIFIFVFRGNFEWYMLLWSLIISGPAFLIGILFYIGWKRKKQGK